VRALQTSADISSRGVGLIHGRELHLTMGRSRTMLPGGMPRAVPRPRPASVHTVRKKDNDTFRPVPRHSPSCTAMDAHYNHSATSPRGAASADRTPCHQSMSNTPLPCLLRVHVTCVLLTSFQVWFARV